MHTHTCAHAHIAMRGVSQRSIYMTGTYEKEIGSPNKRTGWMGRIVKLTNERNPHMPVFVVLVYDERILIRVTILHEHCKRIPVTIIAPAKTEIMMVEREIRLNTTSTTMLVQGEAHWARFLDCDLLDRYRRMKKRMVE